LIRDPRNLHDRHYLAAAGSEPQPVLTCDGIAQQYRAMQSAATLRMGLLLCFAAVGLGCGAEPTFEGIPKSIFTSAKWQYTRSYGESSPPTLRRPLSAPSRVSIEEKLLIVVLETEGQDSDSSEHPAAVWRIAGHGPLDSCPDDSVSTGAVPPNPNECPPWYERSEFAPDFSTNLAPLDLVDRRAAVAASAGFNGVGRLDTVRGTLNVFETRHFRNSGYGLEVEIHHQLVRIE